MSEIPVIIRPQPDELITSWIECIAGANCETYGDFLYHYCNYKTSHNPLPSPYLFNLDELCKRYHNPNFPDVPDILRKHCDYYTMLPFRSSLLNAKLLEEILRDLDEKRSLSPHPMALPNNAYQVCPICLKEGIEQCGRPYIRVWHNLRAVSCCARHKCKLIRWGSKQDMTEVIPATETELRTAIFMYDLYTNPINTNLDETHVLLLPKYRMLATYRNRLEQSTHIIKAFASLFSPEAFRAKVSPSEKSDIRNWGVLSFDGIVYKLQCPQCGNTFHSTSFSLNIGLGCPKCDKSLDDKDYFSRLVSHSPNQGYSLLGFSRNNLDLSLRHTCGCIFCKPKTRFLWHIIRCENCHAPFYNPDILNTRIQRIGETALATNGQVMTITAYRTYKDIDVEFEDGTLVCHRSYSIFKKGRISPRRTKDRTGETGMSTAGQIMKIVAYRTCRDIDIEFEDGTLVCHRSYSIFKKGRIKNPNLKGRNCCSSDKTVKKNNQEISSRSRKKSSQKTVANE